MAIIRRFRRRRRDKRVFRPRINVSTMTDDKMRSRFRFSHRSIAFILSLIADNLITGTSRSESVSPTLQLLAALRFFATGAFMRVIGDSMGLSEATVSRSVYDVASALVTFSSRFIKMPTGTDAQATKQKFYEKSRFPNVLSEIDCTHVRIQAPTSNEPDFVNRKGYHSLNVQMACDADFKFTNCYAEWPGSVHDSRIFRNSHLQRNMSSGKYDGLLIGDSGYPCRPFLMTPFASPGTEKEIQFNKSLCKARVVFEQSFGILKRRFACLHVGLRLAPHKAAVVTVACAILHNIAMLLNEPFIDSEEIPDSGTNDSNVSLPSVCDGAAIRQHICNMYF